MAKVEQNSDRQRNGKSGAKYVPTASGIATIS
jgi:hypothetical protein